MGLRRGLQYGVLGSPSCRTLVTGAQIAMCAALVFFPHFRRYTRRLRTCRSSLSLSQLGRAVRGGCALLLPNVKRINMREEKEFSNLFGTPHHAILEPPT